MGKRKFGQELADKMGENFLSHFVPEETPAKKQQLLAPPKAGKRPIMEIKLNRENSPKIVVSHA